MIEIASPQPAKEFAMRLRNLVFAVTTSVPIAGCAMTIPVAVISQNGDVLKGTNTVSLAGGSFQVSGKLRGQEITCSGSYDALNESTTISMPVICSDGRKGIIQATRERHSTNGSGTVRLTDGTDGTFVFGDAARAF